MDPRFAMTLSACELLPNRRRAGVSLSMIAIGLCACSTLPSSGPTATDVGKSASDPTLNLIGYHLVEFNAKTVEVANRPSPTAVDPSIRDLRPNSISRVGPGDVLAISVFSVSSGFSGSDQSSGNSPPAIELPPITIDEIGSIRVPFAGTLTVSGMTPREIASALEHHLTGKIFDPQVIVNVSRNLVNTVTVTGDLRQPGRFAVLSPDERLLDVIVQAGGPTHPDRDVWVRLTRNSHTTRLLLQDIDDDPAKNLRILPGDRIQATYDPRTFLAFGATDRVAELPIDKVRLSLAEAIARIGGPSDYRADPTAIYLFRYEPPTVAAGLGIADANQAVPILYRINMLDPETYFDMSKFPIEDKDLIYVANARSNKFYKFLGIINSAFGPVGNARAATQ